eukprot:evm.model.scf_1725EXC.4 EVM.evm.TU.scf_1725EXC.4   scf_1725EXC:27980-28231(+)
MPGRQDRGAHRVAAIRVRGFKSVGGRPLEVDLGGASRLVAVVGPNGAGKSNVLDALCFAMAPALGGGALRVGRLAELRNAEERE